MDYHRFNHIMLRRRVTPTERLIFPPPHLWIPKAGFAKLINRGGHLVHADGHLSTACICPCSNCNAGTTPGKVQVALSGIVNNNCASCASLNATFILNHLSTVPTGESSSDAPACCYWTYQFPTAICSDFTSITLRVGHWDSGIMNSVWVGINTAYGAYVYWHTDLPSFPISCRFSNYSLGNPTNNIGTKCDVSGSSCLITAL